MRVYKIYYEDIQNGNLKHEFVLVRDIEELGKNFMTIHDGTKHFVVKVEYIGTVKETPQKKR